MTEQEMKKQNLVFAFRIGLIGWSEFFKRWRSL